jgi:hypothetical protein
MNAQKLNNQDLVYYFIGYFRKFYGKDGFYPFDFNFTDKDIVLGIELRGKQFEGDSFDREAIRDIMLVANNRVGGSLGGLK